MLPLTLDMARLLQVVPSLSVNNAAVYEALSA